MAPVIKIGVCRINNAEAVFFALFAHRALVLLFLQRLNPDEVLQWRKFMAKWRRNITFAKI
jgi:hypothetical protein